MYGEIILLPILKSPNFFLLCTCNTIYRDLTLNSIIKLTFSELLENKLMTFNGWVVEVTLLSQPPPPLDQPGTNIQPLRGSSIPIRFLHC